MCFLEENEVIVVAREIFNGLSLVSICRLSCLNVASSIKSDYLTMV